MPSIKCGNCHGNHESVAEVRDCYAETYQDEQNAKAEYEAELRNERFFEEGPESFQAARFAEEQEEQMRLGPLDEEYMAGQLLDKMTGAPGRDMASEKQVKYASDLLTERQWPDTITLDDLRNMERRQVSKLITQLKLAPYKETAEQDDDLQAGMYTADDGITQKILRVYLGQQSGRLLVKMIHLQDTEEYGYQYIGSLSTVVGGRSKLGKVKLTKMSLEEAKKWGRMTGSCVACGRRLDVPESVEAGIGPVCAGKDYWR